LFLNTSLCSGNNLSLIAVGTQCVAQPSVTGSFRVANTCSTTGVVDWTSYTDNACTSAPSTLSFTPACVPNGANVVQSWCSTQTTTGAGGSTAPTTASPTTFSPSSTAPTTTAPPLLYFLQLTYPSNDCSGNPYYVFTYEHPFCAAKPCTSIPGSTASYTWTCVSSPYILDPSWGGVRSYLSVTNCSSSPYLYASNISSGSCYPITESQSVIANNCTSISSGTGFSTR